MTDAPKPPRKPRAPRATKPAAPDELRLEYMPLATLKRFPGNPKAHDDAAIKVAPRWNLESLSPLEAA